MGLGINSNISSLIAQKNYSYVQKSQSSSLERLSSGLRINKASDDGSGMYIADQLQSQARGLGQAVKNANDAVSIVQTADGALDESIKIVETIKTKSIQASQDGHTLESRKVIQSDIDKLREELDHIARSTSFNGQKLLSGGFSNKEIQVGAYTGETVRISIDSAESTKIGHTTVAEVLPDYTKPIFTTLQDKATGEDIVIKPFQIEYYTPVLMKEELDKLTSEDINKLTNEELGKRTNLDISKLTSTEINELKNQFIDEIVENASDELNKNISNRLVKNGLGELARQINKFEEQTDVKAFPIVESESSILSGNTSDDFKINGITIGNLNVLPNDSDGSLIAAINGKSSETGVTASVTAGGTLELKSSDGRAIKVEGLPRPEVISSRALTTHGYLKMISRNFGQYEFFEERPSNEVVFVDKNMTNYQSLLSGLPWDMEVVLIDPNENGIEKISRTLSKYENLDAIHIISHGEIGNIQLGNTNLTNTNVDNANIKNELKGWSNALSESADILIYGCNVASTSVGNDFIKKIAEITSVDVAASTNNTGAMALGGDWVLETKVGTINSALAIDKETRESWNSIMGTYTLASKSTAGVEGNDDSVFVNEISGNARYVVFRSEADNLVPNDTNNADDIFLFDTVTGTTTRVSVASDGSQAQYSSYDASISDDGRYVVFTSYSDDLHPADTLTGNDIFLKDIQTGLISLISKASDGTKGDDASTEPEISGNGRYVTFSSDATNLILGDTNGSQDVFLHDTQTGQTTLISKASDGTQGNDLSFRSSVTNDGRYVVFESLANNLVVGDTNGTDDVFLHDTQTGVTTLVSKAFDNSSGNGISGVAKISDNGRFIVYQSDADNIVIGDANGESDIFLYDIQAGTNTLISKADDGTQSNGTSAAAQITDDGRYVTFSSRASNLVPPGDTGAFDVFLYDTQLGQMSRVSLTEDGSAGGNAESGPSAISDNGQFLTFGSYASNLVPGTTPGRYNAYLLDINGVPIPPNNPPTISLTDGNPTFTEVYGQDDKSNAVLINSSIKISDIDGTDPKSATVTITNLQSGDELLFTDTATIQGSYNNGSLTLIPVSGMSPTKAEFEAALSNVKFNNTSDTPNTADRIIEFKVKDTSDAESIAAIENVSIIETDDPVADNYTGVPLERLRKKFKLIPIDTQLLRLCDVNVTSFDDAQIAMEIVDVSLRDLDKIRSNVGSVQNQLQSTIANITNTQFNAAASESTIRDVDFADESSNLSKLQVLSQAGMFALKNSGTSMKNLISLLQQN